jgi:endonuclease G
MKRVIKYLILLLLLYLGYFFFSKQYPVYTVHDNLLDHHIFGVPQFEKDYPSINYTGYTAFYDFERRSPALVCYKLKKGWVEGKKFYSKRNFKVDKNLKESAKDSDYRGSGYDRGHLARQADMRGRSTLCEREALYFTNIAPQLPDLNRKVWVKLEDYVQKWAISHDSLWVYTGPIYDSEREYLHNRGRVEIPDSFFKIIVAINGVDGKRLLKILPFIIDQDSQNERIDSYIVDVDSIESLISANFFHQLKPEVETDLESIKPNMWLPYR